MTEEEMRRYRYLRKEIAVERERMAKMASDERAKRIAEIIAEKIERAETEAEREIVRQAARFGLAALEGRDLG